jgi:glutamate--cysteine ligase
MPCFLESEKDIPLAQYGNSNIGKLKTLYREGLGHRYGRLMQTIAGIHYNFSMPDSFWTAYRDLRSPGEDLQAFSTRSYLHLIRNFHRYSWLLLYLFGASPAVCRCFTRNRPHNLEDFNDSTLYKPHATCLRMGNLGYRSDAQGSIFICYNELDNYIDSLGQAMSTPYAPYETIGLKRGDQYLQMNSNLLQLENEFYATIRPKRTGPSGKRPLSLLLENGIEYIEVRALDLNPFLPLGIDAEQIRFLDSFLLYCLLSDSPVCTEEEYFEVAENLTRTVEQGRDPALELNHNGKAVKLRTWAEELLNGTAHSAALLDQANNTNKYTQSLAAQQAKVKDDSLTPSAQILARMRSNDGGFSGFAMGCSKRTREELMSVPLSDGRLGTFSSASAQSLKDQHDVENGDNISFDEFLKQWNDFRVHG